VVQGVGRNAKPGEGHEQGICVVQLDSSIQHVIAKKTIHSAGSASGITNISMIACIIVTVLVVCTEHDVPRYEFRGGRDRSPGDRYLARGARARSSEAPKAYVHM